MTFSANPMLRHTAGAELYPDRGNLFLANPHAGQARDPPPGNTIARQGHNDSFFKHAQVAQYIATVLRKLQNRVADNLAGAMVGDVATTIRL